MDFIYTILLILFIAICADRLFLDGVLYDLMIRKLNKLLNGNR